MKHQSEAADRGKELKHEAEQQSLNMNCLNEIKPFLLGSVWFGFLKVIL